MELTPQQKQQIIAKEAGIGAGKIAEYIAKYSNLSLDDFPSMAAEKRAMINSKIGSMPNPAEQQEWNAIAAKLSSLQPQNVEASSLLLQSLNAYISHWDGARPNGNHVDEAKQLYSQLEQKVMESMRQVEESEWQVLDTSSANALLQYLQKYPHSCHKSEIDEYLWMLTDKQSAPALQDYITRLPMGNHAAEAQQMINGMAGWEMVKNSGDIFQISRFIYENPASPFIAQAQFTLMQLKQQEFDLMRSNPGKYSPSKLFQLVEEGVISKTEMVENDVMSDEVYDKLLKKTNPSEKSLLPDVNKIIARSKPECKPGFTDVYFFGIPSTGKTCVLMGMTYTPNIHINLAAYGGEYAQALQMYIEAGELMPRTPGDFVVNLEGSICMQNQKGVMAEHKVNLIEMSGEEFSAKIANNDKHIFSFDDMGTGTTRLLSNDNRKAFFIIIDPTSDTIKMTREVVDYYDEETGEPHMTIEHSVINQRMLLQKFIDMFSNPANESIMQKVDTINIIVTKADVLGSKEERDAKALELFRKKYEPFILQSLVNLGARFNINMSTNNRPNLYTFSLGHFYVGGLYDYEPEDANKLVNAIFNSTAGTKKQGGFFNSFKNTVG